MSGFTKIWSVWPRNEEWWLALASFSRRQKIALAILLVFGLIAFLVGLILLNRLFFTVEVPASGGELREGAVGFIREINPLSAIADVNKDLVALIYSGLLRPDEKTGQYQPDLAESYEISPDGLIYTVRLRPNLVWHDGAPLTVDDVVFTILKAQDPKLASPKRAAWEGIRAEKIDEQTIRFTLKQPYVGFLETLTTGILPKHLWQKTETNFSQEKPLNEEPIGSGPYKIAVVRHDSQKNITGYELEAFERFALGPPRLKKIHFFVYPTEEALLRAYQEGVIEAVAAITPASAERFTIAKADTAPIFARIFAVFLNSQQSPVLAEAAVREALDLSIDRERIVKEVLRGYGQPLRSPLIGDSAQPVDLPAARLLLEKNGWQLNERKIWTKTIKKENVPLSFTLTTANLPELKTVAELIKSDWETLGAEVTIESYESGDLNQVIIQPRRFQALLFGQNLKRETDWYAYWHSSQRLNPGSNITGYTSLKTDKIVEDLRRLSDPAARAQREAELAAELTKDRPALFLYAPRLVYLLPPAVRGFHESLLVTPADRFNHVYNWYRETRRVWRPFAQLNQTDDQSTKN